VAPSILYGIQNWGNWAGGYKDSKSRIWFDKKGAGAILTSVNLTNPATANRLRGGNFGKIVLRLARLDV
jgi:hypothetical protein